MVSHHFHVTLLPLGTLAGINVRLARERTGRTHKRTQPRVKQYQFLMSWPKLALPSMTAVVRKAVLPVKSSPPAVTTCAARKPEFRRLSLHCFFLVTHIEIWVFVHPYRDTPARAHRQIHQRPAHSSTQRASALLHSPRHTRHHTIMRPVGRPMAPSASFCRPRLPPAMTP